ncbi:UNVERIFIED_CONTAM: hypothetical protein GTU68_018891 [Idotea baltica]|nr:hypothetical protein [Idotea baltica]
MRAGKAAGARLIALGDPDYPADLAEISDAPPLIWCRGDITVLRKPMIALVGARNASSLGTRMARGLAKDLAQAGWSVVSGLARGVDTAAHLASVETGTIAVLAGGVDIVYPAENSKLAEDILAQGVLLSEQPMGLTPQARHFPRRNRIISGLSRAVIVIEAAAKSGSLITARNALDQGRDVAAVPGHPLDARASGCNFLIRDGATLVRSAQDIIALVEAGQPKATEDTQKPRHQSGSVLPKKPTHQTIDIHKDILARLSPSPLAEDQLIRDLDSSAKSVAPALMDLELDGKIIRQSGGLLSLAP